MKENRTPERHRLEVAFDDDDRSGLFVDLHRPSWTMCVGFGQRASVSDYAISSSWLAATCRAVARGGWKEETFSWRGLRLRTVATLRILGRDATFTDHGWMLPAAVAPRPSSVIEYTPWARRG
ncbi:MAG: hypothetical protein M3Y87_24815 [Myxococcota bacterium]|nr:hypothetical protein [Myxococcota bacterium]